MKKILSLAIVGLLGFSVFTMLVPMAKAPTVIVVWLDQVNEQDGRVTPGDEVQYIAHVDNYMLVDMFNTELTLTFQQGTPIGFKIGIGEYADTYTQDYGDIPQNGGKGEKSWYLQVWRTVDAPFYPGETLPRNHILDPVPIGNFGISAIVNWTDIDGCSHQETHEPMPDPWITVEYPDLGPPPTGYEHYVLGSDYYHPENIDVKRAAAKAICWPKASDTIREAVNSVRSWVMAEWVSPSIWKFPLFQSRIQDIEALSRIKQGEEGGYCVQRSELAVSLLRSINISARVVGGDLIYCGFFPVPHQWLEAYLGYGWGHVDPSIGEVYLDDEGPFEGYVELKHVTGVYRPSACKVTDCPHYNGRRPWLTCPEYEEHWEEENSSYNPQTSEASGSVVFLAEEGHFLGLDVYDSLGRHAKVDYETNNTHVGITDAEYLVSYNFSVIILPINITKFDVVVDARNAEQPVEAYNLTASFVVNSTIISQDSCQSTVNVNETERYHTQIADDTIDVTPGIHSITLTNISSSKTSVGQGYNASVYILTQNHGDFTEVFDVTVYANATIILMVTNVTLSAGNSTTITFTWNTMAFALGNYTISATADTVPGEVDTADNNFTDGTVLVTIVGDVNGDRLVDMKDIAPMAARYGAERGDAEYEAKYDLNDDSVIDMKDIAPAAAHYGDTC